MNEVPMAFNQGCKGLVPRACIEQKYLYYFLYSSVNLLNDLGTGATFKELSSTKVKSVAIPLPPLAEQRRIVAVLDTAFAGLTTATAHTRRKLDLLQEIKHSTLHQAFKT